MNLSLVLELTAHPGWAEFCKEQERLRRACMERCPNAMSLEDLGEMRGEINTRQEILGLRKKLQVDLAEKRGQEGK